MLKKTNDQNGRNVWAFFLLTYIYSWTLWLPFVLAGAGGVKITSAFSALRNSAVMLGAFAPPLAAATMIARKCGWSEVKKYFRQALDLHVKRKYLALALLLPVIITAAAHYIAIFTGLDNLQRTFLPGTWPIIPIIISIAYFLPMLVAGGGQEEFGWRGYAQEPLQQQFGVLGGSIVLGVIWAVWHLPAWFLPGDGHSDYSFFAFLISTISLSIILGWLYNASGKKLVTVWVLHAMNNTVTALLPIMHMEKVPQPGYWLWAGLYALAALGITIWFLNKNKDEAYRRNLVVGK